MARRRSFGRIEPLEPRRVLTAIPIISEVLASNDRTIFDEDGDDSDFVELFNAGDSDMSLNRYYLTDNPNDLQKWRFPDVALAAGEYLVVFASNKDRNAPASELHANFRLSSSGEYLALVEPDGQTIAFSYAPGFPQQVTDVSYGVPTGIVPSTLIDRVASGRLIVPGDNRLDPTDPESFEGSWLDPAFDDSSWTLATTGVGFTALDAQAPSLVAVADSREDWVNLNEQGVGNHWFYGYYDQTADPNATYDVGDFHAFVPEQFTKTLTSRLWQFQDGSADTRIERQNQQGHADGETIHWGIRRWVAQVEGTLVVEYDFAKTRSGGDGTTARVFHNGIEVDVTQVEPTNRSFATRTVTIPNVRIGDAIDFAVDPLGPGGDPSMPDGASDLSKIKVRIARVADVGESIVTDIGDMMRGQSTSAYLRLPFTVNSRSDLDTVTLRMQYDDGFVAYLNGRPIASMNAPANPTFDSMALSERTPEDATIFDTFDLSDLRGQFVEGENLLQIHGLNASMDDDEFLIQAELIIETSTTELGQARFFGIPTPGSANGLGAEIVGPQIFESTHTPNVPNQNEPIVVTASVAETFSEVDSVILTYRVMYDEGVDVVMSDDGLGSDEIAGDGIFTAVIPSGVAEPGQMVRWMMTATDTDGTTGRYPPFPRPTKDEEYKGTVIHDPTVSSKLEIFELFLQSYEIGDIPLSGSRGSLFFGGEFYSNVDFSLHGQTSGGFDKQSINLNFPNDHRLKLRDEWPRMDDVNFLTNWADKSKLRNTLAYEQRTNNGAGSHFAFPIHARNDGEFVAVYDLVEDANEEWLERIDFDVNGNLYKMDGSFLSSGENKKTNQDEGDEELEKLVQQIRTSGTTGEDAEFISTSVDYIYDNVNLARMANYLAGFVISSNTDCCHKNYYSFQDTTTDEWWLLAWDLELSFGHVFNSALGHFDDRLIPTVGLFPGGNHLITRLYNDVPGFRDMYLRRVRTLIDDFIKPPGTAPEDLPIEKRIAELIELLREDAALDNAALPPNWDTGFQEFEFAAQRIVDEYLAPRREYLYNAYNNQVDEDKRFPDAQIGNPQIDIGSVEFNPSSGNQLEEYIILTNPNDVTVDISDWQVTGEIHHTFDPGTVLLPGTSIYITPDAKAFRARSEGPSGGMRLFVQGNYDGTLANEGGAVQLVARDGELISERTYSGDIDPLQDHLRVSEVMYNPLGPSSLELAVDNTLISEDFEWIELVNASAGTTIDLTGARLTGGVEFDFSSSRVTQLAPGERALVVGNEAAFGLRHPGLESQIAGTFSGNTALRDSGERILLATADASPIVDFEYSDVDHQGWPLRADGDGSSLQVIDPLGDAQEPTNWRASVEVGGSPGDSATPVSQSVVINEIMSRPTGPSSDQIELYNSTGSSIDLADFFLSDSSNSVDDLKAISLAGHEIPAGAYLVLSESDFNADGGGFGLSGSNGDELYLTRSVESDRMHFVDSVSFGTSVLDESFGRTPNGTGRLYPNVNATFGAVNSLPRVGPVIISEVVFAAGPPSAAASNVYSELDSNDLDYVELHNPTDSTVDLTDWRIRSGISYNFDPATQLAPGQTMLVVGFNPDNAPRVEGFRTHYGIDTDVMIVGGYAGQLNRLGEGVQLQRSENVEGDPPSILHVLEDEIIYDDIAPWPDATGLSLQRTAADAYGNDFASWIATTATPGTFVVNAIGDLTMDGRVDLQDVEQLHAAARTGDASGDLTRDGQVNEDDVVYLVEDIIGSRIGDVDGDGFFTSDDLVVIFRIGGYEDAINGNSTYLGGDWNLDGDFTSDDLEFALRRGGYTSSPPAAAVAAAVRDVTTDPFTDRGQKDPSNDELAAQVESHQQLLSDPTVHDNIFSDYGNDENAGRESDHDDHEFSTEEIHLLI